MQLFSHNTMTYRCPLQWWLLPFWWIARCQSSSYKAQYFKGASYFDLRVRFNNEGIIEFGHGLFRYSADDIQEVLLWLRDNAKGVRIFLEHRNNDEDIQRFKDFCSLVESIGIYSFGGKSRSDNWKTIYQFRYNTPEITSAYSSESDSFIEKICPWLYAKLHNNNTLKNYTNTNTLVMIDFL